MFIHQRQVRSGRTRVHELSATPTTSQSITLCVARGKGYTTIQYSLSVTWQQLPYCKHRLHCWGRVQLYTSVQRQPCQSWRILQRDYPSKLHHLILTSYEYRKRWKALLKVEKYQCSATGVGLINKYVYLFSEYCTLYRIIQINELLALLAKCDFDPLVSYTRLLACFGLCFAILFHEYYELNSPHIAIRNNIAYLNTEQI